VRRKVIGGCELTGEDCTELMARYPDKHFDLAIVDPPYGMIDHTTRNKQKDGVKAFCYDKKISEWDNPPDEKYFSELFRVSKYQIICGGNYFNLPPSRNFIIYRKSNIPETFNMAMCEYLWTNIDGNAKVFDYFSIPDPNCFHSTQKPISLYKWLLSKYAKPDWKILDTHLGSGSSAIACYDMGFPLTACEIDEDYFTAAVERRRLFAAQGTLDFGGLHENS
jgi:site-specific DNA-methyltransferase (adenine-specific)